MMSKTHFAMGLATSLAVIHPESYNECLVAVIGGAAGGVLADCDILDNDCKSETMLVQLIAAGIAVISFVIDFIFGLGLIRSISENKKSAIIGFLLFCILYAIGVFSAHRSFTHSITALILFGMSIYLINAPIAISFAAAYASHLLLDLLNKKNLPVFYPIKFGVCCNLFYADRTANKVFMYIGFFMSALLLSVFIVRCSI